MLIKTADGEAEDFAALYTRHYAAVYAFAYRRTGDHMQAEDVAAQTFLQAFQALPRYEERGAPIAAWLLRIAANIITSRARRGGREVSLAAPPLPQESGEAGPAEWVERWERAAWLRAHLAALSADQRRALWLRYGEDRAMEEVAERLDRSPAAKQLLYRGVVALRARLRDETHNATMTMYGGG